ncbi:MAG: MMPL family transporter [Eudoraea sp.]|uniref:efflux RND transporter permease subunit n=1 Tax=Eudoraea sp. TaxID=1979955 RepID=UPI003C745951
MKGTKLYVNLIFSLLIAGLVLGLFYLKNINFEVNANDYFPEDEKALNDYKDYRNLFALNPDHTIGLLILSNGSLYDSVFFKKLKNTIKTIESQSEVSMVKSLFNIRKPHKVLNGFINLPIIHPNSSEKYKEDSIQVIKNRLLTSEFIGKNQESTFLVIRLTEDLAKSELSKTIEKLKRILKSQNFKRNYFIGRPFIESTFSTLMVKELKYLGVILVLVMTFLMMLIFRSLSLVFITLIIIFFSLIMTYGIYGFFGFRLEVLSNILPVLIILFSINNCLHIYKKYQKELKDNSDPGIVRKKVIKEKFPDIALANLTTAIGFGSLYFSVLPAMKYFGLYAAIAIMSTLTVNLVCFSFLFMKPFFRNIMKRLSTNTLPFSGWYIVAYKRLLAIKSWRISAVIVSIIILIGIFKIDTNTKKLTNLPDEENLREGIIEYGREFGGENGFDIMIRPNQKTSVDGIYRDIVLASDTITKYLIKEGVYNVKSVAQVQDYLYDQFGKRDLVMGEAGSIKMNLYNDSVKAGRISGRMKDLGRTYRMDIEKRLRPLLSSLSFKYNLEFFITGEDYLNDLAHSYRIKEMFIGLLFSIIIVSLLISLSFKSFFYFLISFLANMLPLLMIAGLMGWLGIELRGSTSILFTIGYAIAVDDTIHFLSELRRNRKKEFGINDAILDTLNNVGSPIYLSSLILSIGFFVLLFSSMWDLAIFGLLIGLFILAAMLCDLLILPFIISKIKVKNND